MNTELATKADANVPQAMLVAVVLKGLFPLRTPQLLGMRSAGTMPFTPLSPLSTGIASAPFGILSPVRFRRPAATVAASAC